MNQYRSSGPTIVIGAVHIVQRTLRRTSHLIVVHLSWLMSCAEFLFAIAMCGQCAFYAGSLQWHLIQTGSLFGLLGAMEFFGRLDRPALIRSLLALPDWLMLKLKQKPPNQRGQLNPIRWSFIERQAVAGAGSVLLSGSLSSTDQRRLAQMFLVLYLTLLLWLCLKSSYFAGWIGKNNLNRLLEDVACSPVRYQMPQILYTSAVVRWVVLGFCLSPA